MDNEGTSLFNDGTLFVKFIMFFLKEKPDAYLSYTIKPNIYGSTAAHFLGIPVINIFWPRVSLHKKRFCYEYCMCFV